MLPIVLFFLVFSSIDYQGICINKTYVQNNEMMVVFYNVENLFDIIDDNITNDDEFTPSGKKHWDRIKLDKKINHLYKVILALGKWEPPPIIGLAEVENKNVIEQLVYKTPLKNFNYSIVHYDSPDKRGIDVAMLYRKNYFDTLFTESIMVRFPFNPLLKKRDILYCKGLVYDSIVLHIFVNHWPSRYGGVMSTQKLREYSARCLRKKVDSLFKNNSEANIIIMGDFNDEPSDPSIKDELIIPCNRSSGNECLINLMAVEDLNFQGTIKYKSEWYIFDQIIVSNSLMTGANSIKLAKLNAFIFAPDFLLIEDPRYLGVKPYRTYNGPRFLNGFSDHLPVFIELEKVKN